jgi:hypothetical protein
MINQVQSSLSQAVSRAAAEAEIRRMEMSRSLRPQRMAELLEAQARSAARSPLPYDQLLTIALRAAARPGEFQSSELDALRSPADPIERHAIAREVFARYEEAPYRAGLKAAPDWELRRATRKIGKSTKGLARWLRSSAELARQLWDHPALPVKLEFRGAILGSVTALEGRAAEFEPLVSTAIVRDRRQEMAFAGGI